MQASRQDAIAEQCPESVQAELKQLYGSLCELSRHFWGCFPPTTPALREKTRKMYDTLRKFQQVKLRPFENELARAYSSMSSPLTNHINQMLEAIFSKYAAWKQKKIPTIKWWRKKKNNNDLMNYFPSLKLGMLFFMLRARSRVIYILQIYLCLISLLDCSFPERTWVHLYNDSLLRCSKC